ncbi:hypothetical protein D3C76_528000 [compost metagenome]
MGTSSIYNGPKDRNPLLPEGFEDNYNSDNPNQNEDDNQERGEVFPWKVTKNAMSQFVTGRSSNKGRIPRSYVRALGGARNAAKSAKSGSKAAIRLGQFLSDVINEGIEATFRRLNIEYRGKNVESLFSEMVNILSEDSNTKEDIAARNASIDALSQLYDFVEENGMDIESLERMDESFFNKVMSSFISNYLIERLLKDLQSRLEKYADNISIAISKEKEVKEYISESVEVKLSDIEFRNIEYRDQNIDTVIEAIYRECYEILEEYL